jgi:hydrogenase maturation protease
MTLKIVFIGNPICGDDGIGPYLYNKIKNNNEITKLKNLKLYELGVIGLDLISFVEDDDQLIIVDAVITKNKKNIGKVIKLGEKDLKKNINLVSMHDFGVEQTSAVLRIYKPKLKEIIVIGILINETKIFNTSLSLELKKKIPEIKKEVCSIITKIHHN